MEFRLEMMEGMNLIENYGHMDNKVCKLDATHAFA